jgi:AraC-like DNA-binding protein
MRSSSKLRAAPPGRGVLWASEPDGRLEARRVLPSADLAPFIHHYGSVHWDLRSPFAAETLQHPAGRIELDAQGGDWRVRVVGVRTGRFGKRQTGTGQFFIVQFRPATLQPLLGAAMSDLTNRTLPAAQLLGPRADDWARALQREQSLEAEITTTEAFLRSVLPALPPAVATLCDLVERVAAEPALNRVELVAAAAELDVRTLQRRFKWFVGVHPKWVIQRYRLLEAAQQLRAAQSSVALAGLAAELGYADQAHFVRDFRRVVGRSPGAFARSAGPAARRAV